ncbi:MAG: carboxypeptidase-like regulatory domain-containing protein [Gammaproteobacteria bacterium]|nr:carboxypeptidase-like regulatory domain-containing protein [Gammaproteobacteria bacterium]
MQLNKWLTATALGVSLALSGCFLVEDNDDAQNNDNELQPSSAVKISGVVYIPAASKFEKVSALETIYTNVFGKAAYAALAGTTELGAGTVIKLIDTTLTGEAAIIAQTVSGEGGTYELDAPEDFVPAPKYIVRAEGSDGQTIESRVSETTVDVDPVTHAASKLVEEVANDATKLAKLTKEELLLILEEVQNALTSTSQDISGLTSIDAIAAEIKAAALDNEETTNILFSTASSGEICGKVTGANDQGLESISVVARDYRDWVTRAKTKTDANGDYCLNVPVANESINGEIHNGEYIVGAINRTGSTRDPDKHASEWWTSTGGKPLQWEGEKIILTTTSSSITKDFNLALGARIKGTVVDPNGNPLQGISVVIRDYETWFPLYASQTQSDGSYKMNVPAGDYVVIARNKTRAPYATEIYADSDNNGISDNLSVRERGEKVSVSVGGGKQLDFKLKAGVLVYGEVLDDFNGNPVTGIRVRFDLANDLQSGFTTALRTNKQGKYKVWLPPYNYSVRSRGQIANVDLSNSAILSGTNNNKLSLNFTDVVTHAQTKLLRNDQPVSQAVALLRDVNDVYNVVSQEISATDGIVDIYIADTSKTHILEIKVKEGESGAGQMIWVDQSTVANAYTISRSAATPVSTSTDIPTQINMPAGYKLSGTLTVSGVAEGLGDIVIKNNNSNANENFTKTDTRLDGSYSVYLAPGSYKLIPKDSDGTPGTAVTQDIVDTDITKDFAM